MALEEANKSNKSFYYAVFALVTIVAALLAIPVVEIWQRNSVANCTTGQVAGGEIGGPFKLVDGSGNLVSDQDVFRQPSLVYFGFTYCPDVCPLDVARNAAAVDILAQRGIEATPVFISVDPERDTPAVVEEFAEAYHPRMIGLTGTLTQVQAAADAYRVYFKKQSSDSENYFVDHTTFTYLMLPNSRFADYFRRDATAQDVAEQVACFVEAG